MKKWGKIILVLAFLIVILRVTGAIGFYRAASTNCEPNIELNSVLITTILLKPDRMDFGMHRSSDSLLGSFIIQRLIAKPFDVLECKEGLIYVNGENVDEKIDLKYSYIVSKSKGDSLIQAGVVRSKYYDYFDFSMNRYMMHLSKSYIESSGLNLKRVQNDGEIHEDLISKNGGKTIHNFGPVTLPEGKFFFLGDNRDNSLDSRYLGFVDKKEISGKLLFNF